MKNKNILLETIDYFCIRKKFWLLPIVIMLFMITPILAFEFDNVKNYNEETKTISVINAFGLGDTIAEIELRTPLDYYLSRGYQKVAEFEVTSFQDYTEAFKELELFDKNKGNEKFIRDYDYKVRSYETIIIDDYTTECLDVWSVKNETFLKECNRVLFGTHEEQKEVWTILDSFNFKINDVLTIGIFTEVQKGDKIEWIPNFFGVRISEWAFWTEDLNVGIIAFFKLNNSNVLDSVSGEYNGTITNVDTGLSGIINNSYYIDATADKLYTPININSWDAFSFSAWVNYEGVGSSPRPIFFIDETNSYGQMYLSIANNNTILFGVGTGSSFVMTSSNDNLTENVWEHVAVTLTINGEQAVYINGVKQINNATAPGLNLKQPRIYFFTRQLFSHYVQGRVDEIGIWNRSLTSSEITDLYNEGNGITYTLEVANVLTDLIIPDDNLNTTLNDIEFSVNSSLINVNLTNVTLYIWNSSNDLYLSNFTSLSGNVSVITNWTILNIPDDIYIWNALTKGTSNTSDWGINRTFIIDTIEPLINLISPTGIINYVYVNQNLSLNWSIIESNLDSCWFDYNSTNTTLTCGDNNYSFIITNQKNLTFWANDTLGNLGSNTSIWDYNILELDIVFENETIEGSLETFMMNLTLKTGLSLSEALLIYNGTEYSSSIDFSGGVYSFSSSIIIPLINIDSNVSFFFNMTVDGIEYSSSINSQFISDLQLSVCGGVSNDTLLNMSLVDEVFRTTLVGDIEISGDIISKTSGEVVETISQGFENINSASICFSPVSSYNLYLFDVEIRYTSTGYVSEFYIIQKADMGGYPINLTLYDLNSTTSTEFLIKYQGDDLIVVEGAVIQLLRKYIANDTYEIVEAPLTSNLGTAVVHIDLDTNKYQAVVVKDGVVLDTFTNIVFDCESELSGLCTQNLFGSIDSRNFVSVENLEDFSVVISEVNNTITTIFSIPSGTPATINIQLKQIDMFGNSTLCNQTIFSSAGSIDCTYDNTIGDSIVSLEVSKNNLIQLQKSYYIKESGGVDWLGNNFFIVLILLLSLTGMAVSSPEWIVVNGIITFIIGGGVWLLNGLDFVVGLGGLIWLFVSGGILIFKLTTQEGI